MRSVERRHPLRRRHKAGEDDVGNTDFRPCVTLWAVVEYVSKYATKAPSASQRSGDVLQDAVGEVLRYVPEGEGQDLLRASLQKVYTRTLGQRDPMSSVCPK